jgi:flagellar basal-body rod protein FlgG
MNGGIYSAAAGMLTSAERLNVISNNLANVNTTGFKSDVPFEQVIRFLREGPYPGKDQPILGGTVLDHKPGPIRQTGRKLDLAIAEKGFFEVKSNNQKFYTRNGALYLNSKKELVTGEGLPVMDKFDKEIKMIGKDFYFSKNGDLFIDGAFFTSIKIVDLYGRNDLKKRGNYLFELGNAAQSPKVIDKPDLVLSSLEGSNSEIVKELGEMITVERAYEFQQKALETILFESIKKTINNLAKPI